LIFLQRCGLGIEALPSAGLEPGRDPQMNQPGSSREQILLRAGLKRIFRTSDPEAFVRLASDGVFTREFFPARAKSAQTVAATFSFVTFMVSSVQ